MDHQIPDEGRHLFSDFPIDDPYCGPGEMQQGIREVGELPVGSSLSELQRRAVLENCRLVLTRTLVAKYPKVPRSSLEIQSRLHRWEFLAQADERAAAAYRAVLVWCQIEVPECLLPDQK